MELKAIHENHKMINLQLQHEEENSESKKGIGMNK
jgi:hypothetical protein